MRTQQQQKINKKDAFSDADEKELYRVYSEMELEPFRQHCKTLIEKSFGKDATKARFLHILTEEKQQHKVLSTTVNFFYAGKGLKV